MNSKSMAKSKWMALGLGLAVLGTEAPLPAEVAIARPPETSHTERVDFVPAGTVRLDDSFGDLYIEGWDRPAVEITVTKEMQDYNARNASASLERVHITTERPSANELKISTAIPPHSFFRHPFGGKGDVNVRYELRVPRDSHLVIGHGGGNILIDNVTGSIDARNREGDITVILPGPGPYSIDARSKMGTVISDFDGTPHVKYFVGEKLDSASGPGAHPIHLRVGFGGITIKEMQPEAVP